MNQNYSKVLLKSNDSKKDRWRQALSASAVLWLTVCFFGPLILELTQSHLGLISNIISLLFVSSILIVLTSLLLVHLMPLRLFEWLIALLVSLGFIIYMRAYFIPYAHGELIGTIINLDLRQHYFSIGAVLLSVVLVTGVLSRGFIVCHINTMAILFITFQLVFAALWIMHTLPETPKYHPTDVYKNSFSKSQNILMLVLDSFWSSDFKELVYNDDELSNCLKGFTFYTDSLGGYSSTSGAVPHILSGLFHDNSVALREFLRANLPTESIPGILKMASYRTEAYGIATQYLLHAPVLDNITTQTPLFINPNPSDVIRLITQFGIKCAPDFAKANLMRYYYKLSAGVANDLFRVEELEKSAHAEEVEPGVFKYEHFYGVHAPYELSESMNIKTPSYAVHARKEQAKGSIRLCCRYLEVLKKIGVFDNSMIFVIADHGNEDQSPFPLMLWKPFNGTEPFRFSSKPVAQSDIIKTICDELGIHLSRQHAESLRNKDYNLQRIRRHIHYNVQEKELRAGYFPDMREFIATGRIDRSFSLVPTFVRFLPGRSQAIPQLEIGSTIHFGKYGNYAGYIGVSGWSFPQTDHVWNDGNTAELYLPIRNIEPQLKISIRCEPFFSAPYITKQPIRVFGLNGKVLFAGELTQSATLSFLVPSDAFIGDLLALKFQFDNAVSCSRFGGTLAESRAVAFQSLTITTDSESVNNFPMTVPQ